MLAIPAHRQAEASEIQAQLEAEYARPAFEGNQSQTIDRLQTRLVGLIEEAATEGAAS